MSCCFVLSFLLSQVFTSALAHSVYVPFCKLAGNIHLDQTLSNKDLIHSLVAKVEVLLQANHDAVPLDDEVGSMGVDGKPAPAGSLSQSTVSSNFGKDVAVSGNRINIAGAAVADGATDGVGSLVTPSPSTSQLLSPSRIPLSPDLEARALIDLSTVDLNQLKSLEMNNNARHLKGAESFDYVVKSPFFLLFLAFFLGFFLAFLLAFFLFFACSLPIPIPSFPFFFLPSFLSIAFSVLFSPFPRFPSISLSSFHSILPSFHNAGNWLQYWEHEQGLSLQDANSFEFKGIRLQSFVGHTGNRWRDICVTVCSLSLCQRIAVIPQYLHP